jgi:CDP-diacylglycerol--glycerol-3-phosphate 3-phosphatidyltransferase
MTDDQFLHAFVDRTLPVSAFHHRDHLRLAWLVVQRHGAGEAPDLVARGLRSFAEAHGHGPRYHETMTRFWASLVAHAVRHRPAIADFGGFLGAFPMLLDTSLPFRHWSRGALMAPEARAAWREPDLMPLPF